MVHLEIAERQLGEAVVLAVSGRLIVDQRDCAFCDRIDALLAAGIRLFVIDLRAVSAIDSAGVGALVWKYRSVTGRGGTFVLLQPSKRVRTILHITRLDSVFDIFETEGAALAAVRSRVGMSSGGPAARGRSPAA